MYLRCLGQCLAQGNTTYVLAYNTYCSISNLHYSFYMGSAEIAAETVELVELSVSHLSLIQEEAYGRRVERGL